MDQLSLVRNLMIEAATPDSSGGSDAHLGVSYAKARGHRLIFLFPDVTLPLFATRHWTLI